MCSTTLKNENQHKEAWRYREAQWETRGDMAAKNCPAGV